MTGVVLDIKKFAIHDGPGVRTTVFLKGCPLRCLWCHNPHSQRHAVEVGFQADFCTGCGSCATACERDRHDLADGVHRFDRDGCARCGACVDACLNNALTLVGAERTVEEVIAEVIKDRAYYTTSGGGVTISGGEPMAQFAFTRAFLQAAKAEGLHTVLDTCGWADFDRYAEIMPLVDLVHYDIKEMDSARHERYTGQPNERILDNLRRIDALGAPIILRCPIIPGLNDRDDHLDRLGPLAADCRNVEEIHILPFHPYGSAHAQKIGMDWELASLDAATDEQAEAWIARAAAGATVPVRRD